MPLSTGTRLGPYEIVAPLGAGGMGEVYRARDPRLGRDVAIKVLPTSLLGDSERLARFEREARLLAAMSHSGIASIHGLEDGAGTPALVMELVEGPTLAERIARGPLPSDEALAVARQIAEALEYAHDRGVIHRDLKPANIKLRPDGAVKVLDFGLARALDVGAAGVQGDMTQSPTLTQRMTQAGMILGTAAYMAPEQARGREADRRADIWAFGAVLYEMLTGSRAFHGETISETLASVMRDEPDWAALPSGLSPGWERLIRRCLMKDPRRRLQAIGEARIALEDLDANPDNAPALEVAAPSPSTSRASGARRVTIASLAPWLLASLAVIAATKILGPRSSPSDAVREVSIVPPPGETFANQNALHFFAISPDARTVAYTIRKDGQLKLRLRRLDRRSDIEITGTESPRSFFFSPDGEWLGFFDRRRLCKVSLRGGTPEGLADAGSERLGTWLNDGTIVYTPETTTPLYRVSETGGTPVAITQIDSMRRERTHRYPSALDGGPWVVFTVGTSDSPGDYDNATIDVVSVKTGERRRLLRGARRAVWAPPGYLVFARGNDLYAVPIDPHNPRITQKPLPVLEGVSGNRSSGASYFSVADDGTMAWEPVGGEQSSWEVGWFDRRGQWTPTAVPAGEYRHLALSPDGTRAIALVGQGGGAGDLWLADLDSGRMNRLTYGNRSSSSTWLPDGQRFAYARSDSSGKNVLAVRRLDGAGGEREVLLLDHPLSVTGSTPDGRFVLWSDYGLGNNRLHLAPTDSHGEARDLPSEGAGENAGAISPNQEWLAFISNRTLREEVCIRRFGGPGSSWQVSTNGGGGVRWGRAGRDLLHRGREARPRCPRTSRRGTVDRSTRRAVRRARHTDRGEPQRLCVRRADRPISLHSTPSRRRRAPRDRALGPVDVAVAGAAEVEASGPMTLAPGTSIGPYEIVAPLGAGGMGEVFRARDPRLGRDVAIKALPPTLAAEPERLARFRREAQTLAALNHPNIAAIYGLEEAEGAPHLVLELVEGESLAARLARGALLPREALTLGIQIASAVEAAHERGIVHRDLKPGNVMITPSGIAKVLDFGLAKINTGPEGGDLTQSPTVAAAHATVAGMILGTAAYMSPEQARGAAVDRRSDVWSFGCVLFECYAGRPAFDGATPADLIARILEREPEWAALPAGAPPRVREILRRCLRKDAEERPRDIRDVRLELSEVARGGDKGEVAREKSIAVLPFENLSGADDEYFADGVTDEILNVLAHLQGLRVAARASCFAFKGRREDLRVIGEKLDVATVLEGTVRRSGSRLRITAQLANAADGYQLWSERYDREMTDVFEVQDEIANAIATRLRGALHADHDRASVRRSTTNLEAYELFLKGRALQLRRGRFVAQAIPCFERAITLDPRYAEAMAWLSDSYRLESTFGGAPSSEVMPKAKSLAERALAIDPGLADAWTTLACVAEQYERDGERTRSLWPKPLEVEPRHSRARCHRALWGITSGSMSPDEAVAESARAVQDDPLSGWVGAMHSHILGMAGRHAESTAEAERSVRIDDESFFSGWNLVRSHAWAGHYDRAFELAPALLGMSGRNQWALGALAWTYGKAGRTFEARAVFDEMEGRSRHEFIAPFWLAVASSSAGLREESMRFAERAVVEHDPLVIWARIVPFWDQIRTHPRFEEVVRGVWG